MRIEPLGELTAIHHRASGATHLVASPVPELLEAMAGGDWWSATALLDALAAAYDLADRDADALAARLDELAAAGVIEAR